MKIQYYIVLFGLLYLSFIVGHNIGFERGVSKESSECRQQLNDLMGGMSNVCNTSPSTDEEIFFYQSNGEWHVIIPQNDWTYKDYIRNDTGWIIPEYERGIPGYTKNGTYEYHWKNGTSWYTDGQNIRLPYVNVSNTFISGFNSSVNSVWYNTTNASYENGTYEYGWNGTGWNPQEQMHWHNITITK